MRKKSKGVLLAGFGGSMWGFSGIFAQLLFNQYAVSSEWLVSTRLLISGIFILLYASFVKKENIFAIVRNIQDRVQLLIFSFIGMVGAQYLFFKAIEVSNASLATILQFTGPIFVYLYLLIRKEKPFNITELVLVLTTFTGVFLIVTKGDFTKMAVSPLGLLMGIGSAVAVAFYSLQPRKILARYPSSVIVGWAMLSGGLLFQFIQPIGIFEFEIDGKALLLLAAVIFFGTILGFLAYLSSLKYIDASLASIMTALEPLLATVLSVLVFQQAFSGAEIIGIAMVVASVLVLSKLQEKKKSLPLPPKEMA